ncbi:MAG: methyltransferase domain-containing protein [Desulfovibrio sp.]|nr:methyltransferase domain-containing protein [Desulfovibrio sp.]
MFCQFLRSPGRTGSICPSSRFLAHTLVDAALADAPVQGLIIDLGSGTGAVSQELLGQGIAPGRILAVDVSASFAAVFRQRCPGIELRIDDAKNLTQIIAEHTRSYPLQAIISSLPLRSLPRESVSRIMPAIWRTLHDNGGALIQYTYAVWMHSALERYGFTIVARYYAPLNLPPALVEKYLPGQEAAS